jgi:hypothetical protein
MISCRLRTRNAEAVERFDPGRGFEFDARPRGELKRHFRPHLVDPGAAIRRSCICGSGGVINDLSQRLKRPPKIRSSPESA